MKQTENCSTRSRCHSRYLLCRVPLHDCQKQRLPFLWPERSKRVGETAVLENVGSVPVEIHCFLVVRFIVLECNKENFLVAAVTIDESVSYSRKQVRPIPSRAGGNHRQTGVLQEILSFFRVMRQRDG